MMNDDSVKEEEEEICEEEGSRTKKQNVLGGLSQQLMKQSNLY